MVYGESEREMALCRFFSRFPISAFVCFMCLFVFCFLFLLGRSLKVCVFFAFKVFPKTSNLPSILYEAVFNLFWLDMLTIVLSFSQDVFFLFIFV